MKKNIIIFIVILFMCIGAILGILCYNTLNKSSYSLNIPATDSIDKIILEQKENFVEIDDEIKIKDIVDILNGVKRVTNQESVQDYPINVDNEIKIDFEFKTSGTSTIFVYEKNNKYYIEQPYNGIYRISPDEYNSIEKYLR